MTDTSQHAQSSVDLATICCVCNDALGTERALVTLHCLCKAHTQCFLFDLGVKRYTEIPEVCPRCRTDYISMDLREQIHQRLRSAEIEAENDRQGMNPCFILNESSPEFVTDIAKCKEIAKTVKSSKKEYNTLVSATVKKYKEDTNAMVTILRYTKRDAILKINAAQCTKTYYSNARRFSFFVNRMVRRYGFNYYEWVRFTRQHYPSLCHGFNRYAQHTYFNQKLRRRFRYRI